MIYLSNFPLYLVSCVSSISFRQIFIHGLSYPIMVNPPRSLNVPLNRLLHISINLCTCISMSRDTYIRYVKIIAKYQSTSPPIYYLSIYQYLFTYLSCVYSSLSVSISNTISTYWLVQINPEQQLNYVAACAMVGRLLGVMEGPKTTNHRYLMRYSHN